MKQKWVYKKKKRFGIASVSLFYFVWPCFVTSTDQCCRSVSFVSFVIKQKRAYKEKVCVSLSYFILPCFLMSYDQDCRSISSCFRVFPLYLICFIYYETEMSLKKIERLGIVSVSLFHFISPCFITRTNQGFWSVLSCFITNETDHQWELLLVSFICFIQSIWWWWWY